MTSKYIRIKNYLLISEDIHGIIHDIDPFTSPEGKIVAITHKNGTTAFLAFEDKKEAEKAFNLICLHLEASNIML